MYPIAGSHSIVADSTLGNFAFMVWKLKVHAATMYVKLVTKIFATHCGAFDMPAGKTITPGTGPPHDVLSGSFFPKCKIRFISFFFLVIKVPGGVQLVIEYPTT